MVKGAQESPLEQRPETLDALRVDPPPDIFSATVADRLMLIPSRPQVAIARMVIRSDQLCLRGHPGRDKALQGPGIRGLHDLGDDRAAAAQGSQDWNLPRCPIEAPPLRLALLPFLAPLHTFHPLRLCPVTADASRTATPPEYGDTSTRRSGRSPSRSSDGPEGH